MRYREKTYFMWLLDAVHFDRLNYRDLMELLHKTEFHWELDRDESRAIDGVYLREDYELETGIHVIRNDSCSVLEMLVALALRIDSEYISSMDSINPEPIFWEMIRNLGLSIMTDRHFDGQKASNILHNWMDRMFRSDGFGSIFPLKHTEKDQRKVEIWGQMLEYLSENY